MSVRDASPPSVLPYEAGREASVRDRPWDPARFIGRAVPIVIALVALALRVWGLDRTNLWLDEAASHEVTRLSLAGLLEDVRHSPLGPVYFVLLKGWVSVFGTSVSALRSLSVVASLGVLFLVFRLATRLYGRATANVAALLVALSPTQLYFAQEAKLYMMMALLSLTTVIAYLAWREEAVRISQPDASAAHRPVRRREALWLWLWLGLSGALLLATSPMAVMLLAALWIDAALVIARARRAARGRIARSWLLAQGVTALVCLPLVLAWDLPMAYDTQTWRPALSVRAALAGVVDYGVKQFHGLYVYAHELPMAWGEMVAAPGWPSAGLLRLAIAVPGVLVALAFCLRGASRGAWRSPARVFWLAVFLPLAGMAAISLKYELGLTRYAFFVSPFLLLLIAQGITRLPYSGGVAALTVFLAAAGLGVRQYGEITGRDTDYRRAAALVTRWGQPGDVVAIAPPYMRAVIGYYLPSLQWSLRDSAGRWLEATIPGPVRGPTARWFALDYRAPAFGAPATTFALPGERVLSDTLVNEGVRLLRLQASVHR